MKLTKGQKVFADPHGACNWKVGRKYGRRVLLWNGNGEWDSLDIHITADRVALWARMLAPQRTHAIKRGAALRRRGAKA